MSRKAFLVQVELHVQTITCPGVWLCPNGKISLKIYMLGSNIQTHAVEPVFPIVFDEVFVFSRSYYDVGKLGTLQKIFNKDSLYIELIQWQTCEKGHILATFQTTLAELLYPESRKQSLGNAEVDLLMEPMSNFPGILAPKIEVKTKTTIQDEVCPIFEKNLQSQVLCNPNLITSNASPQKFQLDLNCGYESPPTQMLRQKAVCHTKRCHLARCSNRQKQLSHSVINHGGDKKPPFVVRKVPEELRVHFCYCKDCRNERLEEQTLLTMPSISKESKSRIIHPKNSSVYRVSSLTTCCQKKSTEDKNTSPIRVNQDASCECGIEDHADNCPVCAKYRHYFESRSIKSQKRMWNAPQENTSCPCQQPTNGEPQNNTTAGDDVVLCNYPSIAQKLHTRLSETLSQCVDCTQNAMDNCPCGDCGDCNLQPPHCSVGNLSQFYKKFYTCK